MPAPRLLQHIPIIGEEVLPSSTRPTVHRTGPDNTTYPTPNEVLPPRRSSAILLGAGLPPIPAKLVSRIEAGEFIEMAELLPDRLDPTRALFIDESDQQKTHRRRKPVTNILEWAQCFAIYTAVLCRKYPQKLPDMLSYLILIVQTHMEYEGDAWLGYDRRFRQRAASNPQASWDKSDSTLWDIAFSGKAKANRCHHCFSLSHTSSECEWSAEAAQQEIRPLMSMSHQQAAPMTSNQPRAICKSFNFDPNPGCTFKNCTYEHVCWYCYHNPYAQDKIHKAVFCPANPNATYSQPRPARRYP